MPFEAVKSAATGGSGSITESLRLQQEEERKVQVYALLHESYDSLLARQQPEPLQAKLTEIFSRLPPPQTYPSTASSPPCSTSTIGLNSMSVCNPVTGLKPLTLQLPYSDIYPDIVLC